MKLSTLEFAGLYCTCIKSESPSREDYQNFRGEKQGDPLSNPWENFPCRAKCALLPNGQVFQQMVSKSINAMGPPLRVVCPRGLVALNELKGGELERRYQSRPMRTFTRRGWVVLPPTLLVIRLISSVSRIKWALPVNRHSDSSNRISPLQSIAPVRELPSSHFICPVKVEWPELFTSKFMCMSVLSISSTFSLSVMYTIIFVIY